MTKPRGLFLGLASLFALVALAACGSTTTTTVTETTSVAASEASQTTTTDAAPEAKPTVDISWDSPQATTRDQVTLKGSVTYGAKVKVGGQHAAVTGTTWSKVVAIKKHGDNVYHVTATKKGYDSGSTDASVTRKQSAAEKAAARAARQAALAAKKENYIASASTFPYNQLLAHPSRYEGKAAKFYGKILQVQEDGIGGTVILLSVTDQGYGFWDDNVYVTYDGEISGAEDDMLTAYGTMTGTESYDTQAGGNTTVPRMHAKYISE